MSAALTLVQKAVAKTKPISRLLIGRCWPSKIPNAARILVKTLDFDKNLNMYFPKYDALMAHDPDKVCRTGDFVLIEELPRKLTRDITHKVRDVVYPCGDITDPITGKKCVRNEYRDEIEWKSSLWGKNDKNTFDYNTAPPRGSQKGVRDFSHKPGYKKWHEFLDKEQPEATN